MNPEEFTPIPPYTIESHWLLIPVEGGHVIGRVPVSEYAHSPEASIGYNSPLDGFKELDLEQVMSAAACIRPEDLKDCGHCIKISRRGMLGFFQAVVSICPPCAGEAHAAIRALLNPFPPGVQNIKDLRPLPDTKAP